MAFIILLPILSIVLFILYKVVTSTNLPKINVRINANRRNSPTIKNSFNTTTNIDKSTHINHITEVSNSPTNTDSSAIESLISGAIILVIILNIYKKYFSQINIFLICAPFAILMLYLFVVLIFKIKNTLSIELIIYLSISFLAVLIVIVFYFFPIFKPDDINALLSSEITFSSLSNPSVSFIFQSLLGSFAQLLFIFIALIQLIKNYTYNQIIFNYKFIGWATIFTFLLTSGIVFRLLELFKSYSSINI
ncbi:hypothetical protein [Clostridium algidicarnis]|uniref:hypothetical protein n=1 Tax=Clostridium algidicarnis TaxID=37659 RepID=UPI003FD8A157